MLTGISTVDEVIEFFEVWLMRQGLFNPTEYNVTDARIYQKGCDLINEDVDYWANQPMWNLYNRAKGN